MDKSRDQPTYEKKSATYSPENTLMEACGFLSSITAFWLSSRDDQICFPRDLDSLSVVAAPSSADNWEEVQAKARHLLLHTYSVTQCTVQVQTHRLRPVRSCTHCHQPSA